MPGYAGDKEQVLTRLRRIEGQVRGLQRLVDQDAYCIDMLTQISAVDKALKGVAINLLDGHLRHCVRDGVAAGGHDAGAIGTEATPPPPPRVRRSFPCRRGVHQRIQHPVMGRGGSRWPLTATTAATVTALTEVTTARPPTSCRRTSIASTPSRTSMGGPEATAPTGAMAATGTTPPSSGTGSG